MPRPPTPTRGSTRATPDRSVAGRRGLRLGIAAGRLQRLEEQLGRLGAGDPVAPVDDEERDAVDADRPASSMSAWTSAA